MVEATIVAIKPVTDNGNVIDILITCREAHAHIDVWDSMNPGQKIQFQNLYEHFLEQVEAEED